ncbi:uncharacterized protein LOC142333097 isoform X3 [Lycorma delicatula]|uniref:uncharacterized protein LOC142333097 isoform X3 n=1 Tax=Lycorma delicatula TaxID=130591 RepID=UPI003F512383
MRIIIYVMSFFIISAEKFSNENDIFLKKKYVHHGKYANLQARCLTVKGKKEPLEFLTVKEQEDPVGYIKDMYYKINGPWISEMFGETKLDKLKKHKYYEKDLIQLKIYEQYSGENEKKLLSTLLPLLDAIPDKIIIKKGIIYTVLNSIVSGIDITETISTGTTTNSNNATISTAPKTNSNNATISTAPKTNSNNATISTAPKTNSNNATISTAPKTNSNNATISTAPKTNSNNATISTAPKTNSNNATISTAPKTNSNNATISTAPKMNSNNATISTAPKTNSNNATISTAPKMNSNNATISTAPKTNSNNAIYTNIPTRLECYFRPPEKKQDPYRKHVKPPQPIMENADLEYVTMSGAEMYAHYGCGNGIQKMKFQLSDEESEKKIIKKIDMSCSLRLNTRSIMNNFVENLPPLLSTNEENSFIDWFTSDIPFELRFSYICKFVSPLQTFVNKNILQYKILNFTVSGYQLKKLKLSTQCIGLTYCLQHQHINNYVFNLDDYFLHKFEV